MKKILFIILIFIMINSAYSQNVSWNDWLKIEDERLKSWIIESFPGDGLSVRIRIKKNVIESKTKKILILFPKKSSAYNTALDTILRVFENKGVAADFTIVNFKDQRTLGLDAIKIVEGKIIDCVAWCCYV